MSKLAIALAGGLAAVSVASVVLAADNSMMTPHGTKVTITGNVVDIGCYIGAGLHGPKHVECAKACILNGQAMGIETADGNIVTIIGTGPKSSPNKAVFDLVEQKVTATGTEFDSHGVKSIIIESVKKAE